MTESEGPKPEGVDRRREEESLETRLTASEIDMLMGGLALIDQEQRAQLERIPEPDEDQTYRAMRREQAQREIDAADALRQKLIALLDSRKETPPDEPIDD